MAAVLSNSGSSDESLVWRRLLHLASALSLGGGRRPRANGGDQKPRNEKKIWHKGITAKGDQRALLLQTKMAIFTEPLQSGVFVGFHEPFDASVDGTEARKTGEGVRALIQRSADVGNFLTLRGGACRLSYPRDRLWADRHPRVF
jgi:hypothetical protein